MQHMFLWACVCVLARSWSAKVISSFITVLTNSRETSTPHDSFMVMLRLYLMNIFPPTFDKKAE